jgi:hypothetical protein
MTRLRWPVPNCVVALASKRDGTFCAWPGGGDIWPTHVSLVGRWRAGAEIAPKHDGGQRNM